MIQAIPSGRQGPVRDSIEEVIAREGARTVLFAAMLALVRGQPGPASVDGLPDHILRDAGLIDRDISNPMKRRP